MKTIKRRDFIGTMIAGTTVAGTWPVLASGAGKAKRPSFLVMTFEDISPRLGCYGDSIAKTPILDALAKRGHIFTNMYASSPVCAPARATWITGVYPSALGAHHMRTELKKPDQIKCFPEYLREAGYYCINAGKYDYQFNPAKEAWDDSNMRVHWRNRPDPDQPFYMVHNFVTTHQGRTQREVLYNKAGGTLQKTEKTDRTAVRVPGWLQDTKLVRELVARTYENITFTEKLMGKLIDQLEETGVADRTIVIVTSDHGDGGLPRAKEYLYDSGLKVPFIIFVPKQFKIEGLPKAGEPVDRLSNFADFAPTILSLAGLPIPDYMQGRAMLGPQMKPEPKFVYATRDRGNTRYDTMRALRSKDLLYLRHLRPYLPFYVRIRGFEHNSAMIEMRKLHAEGKLPAEAAYFMADQRPPEELFDVKNDPDNLHNLADDPKYAGLLEKLRAELKKEMARIGDTGFIPEGMLHDFRAKVGTEWAVGHGEGGLYDPVKAYEWMTMGQLEPLDSNRVLEGLNSDDPVAQYWSAVALGYYDQKNGSKYGGALKKILDSTYGDIRAAAAFALIRCGLEREAATRELDKILCREQNFWVRLNALNLLDDLDDETFAALRPVLERTDQWKIRDPMGPKRYIRELAQDLLELKSGSSE